MQQRWVFKLHHAPKDSTSASWIIKDGQLNREISCRQSLILQIISRKSFDPAELINQSGALYQGDRPYFSGPITKATYHGCDRQQHYHQYQLTLTDHLSCYAESLHTRVFRQRNSQQITQQLLQATPDLAHAMHWQLQTTPAARPWLWQWQCTDFTLLQQLAQAEEWIFYPDFVAAALPIPRYHIVDQATLSLKHKQAIAIAYQPYCGLQPTTSSTLSHLIPKWSINHQIEPDLDQIIGQSVSTDWQLGDCFTLKVRPYIQSKNIYPLLENNYWYLYKMVIPTLYPHRHLAASWCQLYFKRQHHLINGNRLIWPQCHSPLAATIIDSGTHCPDGFYAIQFDMEATQTPSQLPYVPIMTPANTSAINHAKNNISATAAKHPVGSRVLIKMLDGHLCCPIIIGSAANNNHPSPIDKANPEQAIMRTPGGHTILMRDTPGQISCQINTLNNKQQMGLYSSSAPYGIKINNHNGPIGQYCVNYHSESHQLNIKCQKKLNIDATAALQLQSRQGHISWQARSIEKKSGTHIQYQSTTGHIQLRCGKINYRAKEDLHLVAQKQTISLQAPSSTINQQYSSPIKYQVKNKIKLVNSSSQVTISSGHIELKTPKINFNAAVILVSGV